MSLRPTRWLLPALILLPALALAACPPEGWPRDELDAVKAGGFAVADDDARQALALDLLDCLGDPDPGLRDGIAYEGLATWLRSDALTQDTREELLSRLLPMLSPEAPDEAGFREPFAALVLSEVARTDRIAAWLTDGQRAQLVEAAAAYLEGVRDYRGFDAEEGWRHGVAHGSDVLMQLALNPALDLAQQQRLLTAVAHQVAPAGHAYVYGEPERLARPVLFLLQRGEVTPIAWSAWLEHVINPAPLKAWAEVYGSEAGLAKRHDTRAFLLALYVVLNESADEKVRAYLPPVVAALRIVG